MRLLKASLLAKENGNLLLAIDAQREDIGPRIVARHVELATRGSSRSNLDIGYQKSLLLAHGARSHTAEGLVNDGIARVDPFVLVGE